MFQVLVAVFSIKKQTNKQKNPQNPAEWDKAVITSHLNGNSLHTHFIMKSQGSLFTVNTTDRLPLTVVIALMTKLRGTANECFSAPARLTS